MGDDVIDIRLREPIAFAQRAGNTFDGQPVVL
jgi:hypothetical protein